MKRKTLKFLAAMAVAAAAFAASALPASATGFWTGSVFDNQTGTFVSNIQGFDWSSSGSGNAQGLGPAGSPIAPGTLFTFRYQAALVGLTDPGGNPVTFTGLNSTFQYTAIATLPEQVVAVVPVGPITTVYFDTLPGGTWAIKNGAKVANVGAGTGFDTGTLVADGTIATGQITPFSFNSLTKTGNGSTTLEGLVNFSNGAFLDPSLSIIDFHFEGTLNYPPLDSKTAGFFDNNFYTRYTVATNDIPLKVDGSSKFSQVPEPSTLMLMGSGLLGFAGYGFARRKKSS